MKKRLKSVFALLLAMTLLFSNGTLTGFAATGTGAMKKESRQSSQIALYQNGDLSAAYVEGVESERYTAPAAGTVEAAIYNGLKNFSTEIDVEKFNLNYDQVELAFQMVINSNPDLFYVSNTFRYYTYIGETEIVAIEPGYIAPKSELAQMTANFDKAIKNALSGIDDSMTDLEKALYLHDYLIKLNAYDYENFSNNSVPSVSHSAYGPLVLHTSVCDGTSLAYSYLLGKCGINARLITSAAMAHAWNAIEIDGSWYFADLTYDDPVCAFYDWQNGNYVLSSEEDDYSLVCHDAFLASEALWRETEYSSGCYTGWAQTDIQCTSTKYDDAIWKSTENEYGYCDGYWYYLNEEQNQENPYLIDNVTIMKTEDPTLAGDTFLSLADYKDAWGFSDGSYWPGFYTNVSVYAPKKQLFFNTGDTIYMVDLTDPSKSLNPYFSLNNTTLAGNALFFGLIVLDNYIYFGVHDDPNSKQILFYDYLGDIVLGDVNGDGSINTDDALEVLKIVAGSAQEEIPGAADTNQNNGTDTDDALQILKYVAGIITEF